MLYTIQPPHHRHRFTLLHVYCVYTYNIINLLYWVPERRINYCKPPETRWNGLQDCMRCDAVLCCLCKSVVRSSSYARTLANLFEINISTWKPMSFDAMEMLVPWTTCHVTHATRWTYFGAYAVRLLAIKSKMISHQPEITLTRTALPRLAHHL